MLTLHLSSAEARAALDAIAVCLPALREERRLPGPLETAAAHLAEALEGRAPTVPHLRAHHGGAFECLMCGASYAPNYPCPIGAWAAVGRWFARTHHDCRPLRAGAERRDAPPLSC